MLPLGLAGTQRVRHVLAIGAHADDLEIGCGATVLALTRAHRDVAVHWVVLAAPGPRGDEARASAEVMLSHAAATTIEVHGFRDGYLPHTAAEVKDAFEDIGSRVDPQLILTHTRDDLHQDHRFACELTWNTFRDHLILEYEIPKWDGDVVRPNVYVPLTEAQVQEKLDLLRAQFASQHGKHWFDPEVFRGLMRLRGVECRAPEGFAEAFTARKLTLRTDGVEGGA